MAERPIKKSERLAKAAAAGEDVSAQPSERSDDRPDRRKGGKGKGKGGSRQEAPKSPVNPALMRGPKPVKAQPQPEEPPEPEVIAETGSEENSETPEAAIAVAPAETVAATEG
jgi:hypothetical protein